MIMKKGGANDANARFALSEMRVGPRCRALEGKLLRFVGRHGLAEIISLDERAAEIADEQEFHSCVSAPRRWFASADRRQGPPLHGSARRCGSPRRGAAHERLVDLDLVERNAKRMAEAGVASTEVVQAGFTPIFFRLWIISWTCVSLLRNTPSVISSSSRSAARPLSLRIALTVDGSDGA